MSKLISSVVLILCLSFSANASHIVGGDISYVCLGNNLYQFTVNIYRDCLPQSQGGGNPAALTSDNPAFLSIFEGTSFYDFDSIQFTSSLIIPANFSNDCINNPPNTCISRLQFTFLRSLPPSTQGYTLVYQRCCRNETINNINNPGTTGATYYCNIPPAGVTCNNSAVFKNYPPQIICSNNPFVYDHSAVDPDGDSLSYEFCVAYRGGDPSDPKPIITNYPGLFSVSYKSPFSSTNPLSGNPALSINPITGVITGTPNMQGRFVVAVCCHEWRSGIRINTETREFQFVVTNCSKAVIANIPVLSNEPNTHVIECKSFTINFKNTSIGGFQYRWDFGNEGAVDDTSTLFQPTYTYPDTGTYLVTLWVNQGSTCPDSIQRLVKVYPQFDADFSVAGLLCPEVPINFTDLSTSQFGAVNYWYWTFGDGGFSEDQNTTHAYANADREYTVTLTAGSTKGCRDTAQKIIKIPLVKIFAGNDTVIVRNESIAFNASGGSIYTWTPANYLSSSSVGNPVGFYPDTGQFTYVLQGITSDGCIGYDTIQVTVANDPYLIMPTVFSPNGDGLNDFFTILSAGIRKLNFFKIYNRFGQLVFSTSDIRKGWDGYYKGRLSDLGAYYWLISAVDLSNKPRQYKGDITIVY